MIIYRVINNINGKSYIGKTTQTIEGRWYQHCKSSIYGSNTHLHKSIRKHGPHNFTLDIIENVDSDINIAERKWIAELCPEYNMTCGGDGGWIYDQTGNTWTVQDSSKMGISFKSGNNHSEQWRKAVTGGSNYQCNYIITTPWGVFDTWVDAINAAKILRNLGRKDVVVDMATLQKYCREDIKLNSEGRRTLPAWRGKSTHQLGFGYEEK